MSSFNKFIVFIAVVMVSLQLFSAGANFADNEVADGVMSLVLAVFWGGFVAFIGIAEKKEQEFDRELKKSHSELDKIMEGLLDPVSRHKSTIDTLDKAAAEVLGKKSPNKAAIPKIEKRFHELSPEKWVRLELDEKSKKYAVEVSNEPFNKKASK